jgi:universal stress protein A
MRTEGDSMKKTVQPQVTQTEIAETVIAQQPVFTRILALTDFSHRSQTAVEYAIEVARSMHARLALLHVLPEPSAFDYTMGGFSQGQWDEGKEEAAKKLAEETTRIKARYAEVDSLFRTGIDLHDEIVKAAREIAADLLVVSTHGYTGWKHFLFGSDAAKIVKDAPCPILVVR